MGARIMASKSSSSKSGTAVRSAAAVLGCSCCCRTGKTVHTAACMAVNPCVIVGGTQQRCSRVGLQLLLQGRFAGKHEADSTINGVHGRQVQKVGHTSGRVCRAAAVAAGQVCRKTW